MKPFLLNNEQRKYFGLAPIEPHWEVVPLKGDAYRPESLLYFEGNTIKRYIISTPNKYDERQYDDLTECRTILLPATQKGKPKKLSASVLEQRQPQGVYLSVDGCGWLMIGNLDTQTTFYDSGWERGSSTEPIDIATTIAQFIAETPENHFPELERFRSAKRQHIKFKAGDYFSFKMNRTSYGFGRILLDIGKIRKKKLLPDHHGLFNMMGHPVLVQLIAYASPQPLVDLNLLDLKPKLPSDIMMDNVLLYGEYQIIGHRALQEEQIDFPISYGKRLDIVPSVFLQWGLIHRELPLKTFDKYLHYPDAKGYAHNNPHGYYGLGFRPSYDTVDVAKTLANGGVFDFDQCQHYIAKKDLRNPKLAAIRAEILRAFGLDPSKSYSQNREIAKAHSFSELNASLG